MLNINATLIAVVINFVILIYILNYFLYKPVLKILQDRKSYVENTLSEADAKMSAAKASADEGLQVVNKANSLAKQIVDDANSAAGKIRTETVAAAKAEAGEYLKRAKEEIKQKRVEAGNAIRRDVARLSVLVAEKIIRKKMTSGIQRSMIDGFIKELEE